MYTYLCSLAKLGIDLDLRADQGCPLVHPGQAEMLVGEHLVRLEVDLRVETNPIISYFDIDPGRSQLPGEVNRFCMGVFQGVLTRLLHDAVDVILHALRIPTIPSCLNV